MPLAALHAGPSLIKWSAVARLADWPKLPVWGLTSRAAAVPTSQKIYHITHVDNLERVLEEGGLWADSACARQGISPTNIGYRHIKARRLARRVPAAAGGTLGDYVPFYFCSRSVMLYVIHRGHDDYSGGQGRIVHLVSTVETAVALDRKWAFTDRHAELSYAEYFDDLADLAQVDWAAMPLKYWSNEDETKEKRQAEFLVHDFFPLSAVEQIGVMSADVAAEVRGLVGSSPPVTVEPEWYY